MTCCGHPEASPTRDSPSTLQALAGRGCARASTWQLRTTYESRLMSVGGSAGNRWSRLLRVQAAKARPVGFAIAASAPGPGPLGANRHSSSAPPRCDDAPLLRGLCLQRLQLPGDVSPAHSLEAVDRREVFR